MSSEQYTRCPHCKATFQVNENQLSAAGGKVRCGACMEVFDALAYLITEQKSNNNEDTATKEARPSEIKPDLPAKTNSDDAQDADEELVFEDSDEEKSQASQNLFDESQLSDSLKELDTSSADMFAAETAHHTDVHIDTEVDNDEGWANDILNDDSPSNIQTDPSPRVKASDDEKSEQSPTKNTTNEFTSERSPNKSGRSAPQNIDFYYEEPTVMAKRSIFGRLFIAVGSLALILVLLTQVAWFHYEKISHIPVAKQGFEFACKHLGCTLPELVDLKAIKSSNLVVRSHPLEANTLIIDVVLTNEAEFDQDYPRLALYFSDINGKTVAQQIIDPTQYLNSSHLAQQTMPRDTAIHISLEVLDPGRQAVNYKIRFFPSKRDADKP